MKGKKILLRQLQLSDSDTYFKWINNKELVEFNSSYRPVSSFAHNNWFENVSKKSDLVIFSIEELQTKKLIGSCSLRNIDFIHRNAELQIRIGEENLLGKGYGSEAVELLLKFGFNNLNLYRIYLHVFEDNIRAIKSYEKNGFEKEGLLKSAAYINGKYKNIVLMAITKE